MTDRNGHALARERRRLAAHRTYSRRSGINARTTSRTVGRCRRDGRNTIRQVHVVETSRPRSALAVQQLSSRSETRPAEHHAAPRGAITASAGATPSATEGFTIQKPGRVVEERPPSARWPLPHRRAFAPTRTARSARKFPAACTNTKVKLVVGDFRRSFPAQLITKTDQQPAAPAHRRVGRQPAERNALRTSRPTGGHQEHGMRDRDLPSIGNDSLKAGAVVSSGRTGFNSKLFNNRLQST